MSTSTEAATLHHPFSTTASAGANRRSYRCYNCSHSFHISPAGAQYSISPSSFRCPRCHHRHLLPHHTISPSPPIAPPPPPPPPPPMNSNHAPVSNVSPYYTSDDSDSDYDYDSDSSLLSFTSSNFHTSTPALRSFVNSLPLKIFLQNSTPSLQSCSICLEDFEINPNVDSPVNELPCEHYFHKDCIAEWLKRNYTCPLCRFKFPIEAHHEEYPTQSVEDHETDFSLDLAPRGERFLRSFMGIQSFGAFAAANSDRQVLNLNVGTRNGSSLDVMHDEEGDTLMVDA